MYFAIQSLTALATTAKTLHSYVCLNLPAVYQSIELLVNSINDTLGNRGPRLSRVDSDCPLGIATLNHGPALAQGLVDSLFAPIYTTPRRHLYTLSTPHRPIADRSSIALFIPPESLELLYYHSLSTDTCEHTHSDDTRYTTHHTKACDKPQRLLATFGSPLSFLLTFSPVSFLVV